MVSHAIVDPRSSAELPHVGKALLSLQRLAWYMCPTYRCEAGRAAPTFIAGWSIYYFIKILSGSIACILLLCHTNEIIDRALINPCRHCAIAVPHFCYFIERDLFPRSSLPIHISIPINLPASPRRATVGFPAQETSAVTSPAEAERTSDPEEIRPGDARTSHGRAREEVVAATGARGQGQGPAAEGGKSSHGTGGRRGQNSTRKS